jgi:hypothetical protein
MPAIRPERLKREAEGLKKYVNEPSKLRWHVIDLLEFYADRTKRHGMSEQIADATVRFRIPSPVMQVIQASLVQATSKNPVAALSSANELWSVEVQEARLLAIAILANASSEDLISTLPAWARETRDLRVLEGLSVVAYTGLLERGGEAIRNQIEKWLQSRSGELRKFGLYTLIAIATDEQTDRVHIAFEILTRVGFRKEIITRPGYANLLEVLITRNPGESTGYILEGLKRGQEDLRRVVQGLLPKFPRSHRVRLEMEISRYEKIR